MNNEYKILQLKVLPQKSLFESQKILNELGCAGWNLIAISSSESDDTKLAFLERKG